jgi:hypothetical protein
VWLFVSWRYWVVGSVFDLSGGDEGLSGDKRDVFK